MILEGQQQHEKILVSKLIFSSVENINKYQEWILCGVL